MGLNSKESSDKFMEIIPQVHGYSQREQTNLATGEIASHLQLPYNLYEYASVTNWSVECFFF